MLTSQRCYASVSPCAVGQRKDHLFHSPAQRSVKAGAQAADSYHLITIERNNLGVVTCFVMTCAWLAAPASLSAAGVTLITHGDNGTTTGWITGMANVMSARMGGNVPVYRINVTSGGGGLVASTTNVSGLNPMASPKGEMILMLDWGPVSNDSTTTYQVAAVVAPLFVRTNLIAELSGHALAEFPIQLIGHSRGASLVCQLSELLGEQGIWVDQVTSLDAHPISGDAPVATYENVLYADSYYQTSSFLHLADGQIVPGSAWRKQTVISGGYGFPYDGHSDVHLWYHGTIDLSTPTSDTEATIDSTMRTQWWATVEQAGTNAGFIYTRLGGSNRLSNLQPNGANSSAIRDGFNQKFDLGGGINNNRTSLTTNSGDWPNVMKLDLLSTNPVPQGSDAMLQMSFQWAQPASATMSVQVILDSDQNPLNGNERMVLNGSASGTTANTIGVATIPVPINSSNAPVGNYSVFAKLSAGGRSRVLYAGGTLRVVASSAPPWLDITLQAGGEVILGVNGVPGQTVILQGALDLVGWQPVATNHLQTARWELPLSANGANVFYRASLAP